MAWLGLLFALALLVASSFRPVASFTPNIAKEFEVNWGPQIAVNASEVSQECTAAFEKLVLNQTLEVYVIDAIGKPSAGLLEGNYLWIGHYDECMAIPDFRFCHLQMILNGTTIDPKLILPITWGVCAPVECTPTDVVQGIGRLMDYVNVSQYLKPQDVKHAAAVCTSVPPRPYDAGFVCTVVFCSIIVLIAVLSSLCDACRKVKCPKWNSPLLRLQTPEDVFGHQVNNEDDDVPLIGSSGGVGNTEIAHQEPNQNIVVKIFQCFSVSRNLSKLLDSSQNDRSILCANGIRVISMFWVILGHTFAFSAQTGIDVVVRFFQCFSVSKNLSKLMDTKQGDRSISCANGIRVMSMFWVILGHSFVFVVLSTGVENGLSYLSFVRRFGFQAVANAFFSVDSFFFLSGFLLAFLTFSRMAKTAGKIPWLWFYFHRFWRLTPVYMFTILFYVYISPYLGQGPFWQDLVPREVCPKYWWTNLLYINNFYPKKFAGECIGWSWYLANDMQFFIISPIFLISIFMFPVGGFIILTGALMASFIATASIIGYYDLNVFMNFAQGVQQPDPPMDFMSLVYAKPYCRIAPYLVGIAFGYAMYKIGDRRVRMNPIAAATGWALAAAVAISLIYGTYPSIEGGYQPSLAANIIYGTVSRFAWAIVLSWVIFACRYGYGGWVNDFLSWGGWVVLSRLTYTAYLVHPICLFCFIYNAGSSFHFSIIRMAFYYVGGLGVSYGVAAIFSLAIEYPFANLEKLFMPKDVQSKRKVETDGDKTIQ